MRRGILALFTAVLLTAALAPRTEAQEPSAGRTVSVIRADGHTIFGALKDLSSQAVTLAGSEAQPLALDDVVRMEFAGRTSRPVASSPVVYLANDDRLIAEPVKIDGEVLSVQWTKAAGDSPLRIPLETVRGIVTSWPATPQTSRSVMNLVLDRRESSDLLLLQNGDRVTGELTALDQTAYTLETSLGASQVDRREVQAVSFNDELISFPQPPERRFLLVLVDGSLLTVNEFAFEKSGLLRAKAAFGADVELPIDQLVSLRPLGGRAIYLSDLKPAAYRFTPYLSGDWPLRRDRSVAGGPLILNGREYAKGLGTHSRCELAYDLAGEFGSFSAVVGIDDSVGETGSAVARVLLDGTVAFESKELTAGGNTQSIGPLDLGNVSRLTLIVDFGSRGDVGDHVDWCDAVLIRNANSNRTQPR